MNFSDVGVLVDALADEHPQVFAAVEPHLLGVMWGVTNPDEEPGLVVLVDTALASPPALPPTFRGYPVRVQQVQRPVRHDNE